MCDSYSLTSIKLMVLSVWKVAVFAHREACVRVNSADNDMDQENFTC